MFPTTATVGYGNLFCVSTLGRTVGTGKSLPYEFQGGLPGVVLLNTRRLKVFFNDISSNFCQALSDG